MRKLLLPVFAISALMLNSCSTTQLAGQADSNEDDVYYTEAKAKVIKPVTRTQHSTPSTSTEQTYRTEPTYRTDEQLYGDNSYADEGYYDDYSYDYSSRINRFYYNSPYRPYYDYRYSYGYNPWYTYTYDPFFWDPWLYRPGVSLWIGVGRHPGWYNNYYGYYGGRFSNGYWGPYSYYDVYPGYGGRYYSDRGTRYNTPPSPRPNREGGMGRTNGRIEDSQGSVNAPVGGRPSRGSSVGRPTPSGRVSSTEGSSPSARPQTSRPARTQEAPPRQSAPAPAPAPAPSSRPERVSSPPPSSSGGSSGGSSSGGSSGGSRPSRGGR